MTRFKKCQMPGCHNPIGSSTKKVTILAEDGKFKVKVCKACFISSTFNMIQKTNVGSAGAIRYEAIDRFIHKTKDPYETMGPRDPKVKIVHKANDMEFLDYILNDPVIGPKMMQDPEVNKCLQKLSEIEDLEKAVKDKDNDKEI